MKKPEIIEAEIITPSPIKAIAAELSSAYSQAVDALNNAVRSAIRFGALLIEAERFVANGKGRSHQGEGLKGWLAEHCPEINYSTARVYKMLATRAAKMLGGGGMVIAALQGRSTAIEPASRAEVPIEDAVLSNCNNLLVEATSRRKFEQMYFAFMGESSKGTPGRKPGENPESYKNLRKTAEENARYSWSQLIQLIQRREKALPHMAQLLSYNDASDALKYLTVLVKALEKRLNDND